MDQYDLLPPLFPHPLAIEWGEDNYGLWQTFALNNVEFVFRWIPPGSFLMGSPDTEEGRTSWEDRHPVKLSRGFWLGETTVTQVQWTAVTGKNPSHFEGDNLPVEQVSWEDVEGYILALRNQYPSLPLRFPTEAEWEYACRAGTTTPFNFSSELSLDKVNYRGTWEYESKKWGDGAKQATAPVKSYPCNDWGLFEMHGNVWEWCEDWWQENLGEGEVVDPRGPEAGEYRVIRGGSWFGNGRYVRSAFRGGDTPDERGNSIGFRLALGSLSSGAEQGKSQ